MPTNEFSKSVEMGLKLSKRIYYGKDGPPMSAPKPALMTKTLSSGSSASSFKMPDRHHPTGPMVYAIISDANIVDNPDIRSYQPHVHGRCNPPALIPLHMHGISMDVDCYLDTAFVTVVGVWRVHCVTASVCCDCRIAIPMGEKGSILDVEIESKKRTYHTKLVTQEDEKDSDRVTKAKDGFMMRRNTYTLRVPQVEGGSIIHVKVRWTQKLVYQDDEFCLSVPFTFPCYVLPLEKINPKREKVLVNVNSGTETKIICNHASHPLKEVRKKAGEASFSYEAEVSKWSTQDLHFAYSGFKKEVVFLVDISESMRGAPLEKTKYAINACLSKLEEGDLFNIIAFNNDIQLFSSSLELATEEAIANASEWMWKNLLVEGGTNLMCPMKQAIDMVGKTSESIPLIFLITDGTVEDERDICNMIKGMTSPRICTFGIGSYCNHYFLQMLANTGRGYYDAAYDIISIGDHLQRLLDNAMSPMLANVTLDALENLKSYELYPSRIPDLLSRTPLIISGRYEGNFPESVKARGFLADRSTFEIDIKVRKTMDINLDMLCARREVDILTTQAWLDQNKHLEEKVAKMSLQRGIPSEYTHMILVQDVKPKPTIKTLLLDEKSSKKMNQKTEYLGNTCVGFGNLKATNSNQPPGMEDVNLNEAAKIVMKVASTCYGTMANWACLRCFIQTLSQLRNEQCALALAQICTALACLEFLDCCCEVCDSCFDLCQ